MANRAEARGVCLVNAAAWRAAYEGLLPGVALPGPSFDPSAERVREILATARALDGVILAARDPGTGNGSADTDVLGFAEFRWGEDDVKEFVGDREAELRAIYVHPDCWGQGLGSRLLAAGTDRMPESVSALVLETLAGNDDAVEFYRARGFERDGTSSFEVEGESYPTVVFRRPT